MDAIMSEWERSGHPCVSVHVSVHSFPRELSNLKRLKKPHRERRVYPSFDFLIWQRVI